MVEQQPGQVADDSVGHGVDRRAQPARLTGDEFGEVGPGLGVGGDACLDHVEPGQGGRWRLCGAAVRAATADQRFEMIELEHTRPAAQDRGPCAGVGRDHLGRVQSVPVQQVGEVTDAPSSELVVVQPGDTLECVAQR